MSMKTIPQKGFVNGKFRNVGAAAAEGTDPAADHVNGPPTDNGADLDKMTRADLDKLAAERGIDVSQAKNKDEVIAALRKADA